MLLEKSGGRGPGIPSAGKHTELHYGLPQQHITRKYMVIYLREFSCCAFFSLQGPHPLLFCIALHCFGSLLSWAGWSGWSLDWISTPGDYPEFTSDLSLPCATPSLSYKCAEYLDGINSVTAIKQLPELTFLIVPCKSIQTSWTFSHFLLLQSHTSVYLTGILW